MITEKSDYEVVIAGGSYAGLSAAMTLGRSVRKVLVIDSGKPCNRQTPHSHNFITHDGNTPAAIAEQAKAQVLAYPTIDFHTDRVVLVEGSDGNFTVRTELGNSYSARKLLFATGVEDLMPNIAGFAECWGISVIHCPYCHGYEVREKKTGILTNGDAAHEFAQLIHHWTSQLTIFSDGPVMFDRSEVEGLGVRIIDDPIQEIVHDEGHLSNLVGSNGHRYPLDALYARPAFRQHCPIPEQLGCKLTEAGHIEVDNFQKTSVPGIYAAGDSTTPFRAVSIATAAGTLAGALINHELIQEMQA